MYLDRKIVPRASTIKLYILRVIALFVFAPLAMIFIVYEFLSLVDESMGYLALYASGSAWLVWISWLLFGTKSLSSKTEESVDL